MEVTNSNIPGWCLSISDIYPTQETTTLQLHKVMEDSQFKVSEYLNSLEIIITDLSISLQIVLEAYF